MKQINSNRLNPKESVFIENAYRENEVVDKEIDAMIVKRLSEFKFSDHWMKSVDDKYLTADQLKQKNEYLESERVKEKEKLEKQILETQEKLSKLQSANTCL